ncbi:MAG: hypothetical protein M9921_00585 [Fimbriimonadaceae bacterium]|nr:hypothetical protein [Fimbriimonadaceae bacterium]
MITVTRASDPSLLARLEGHPEVRLHLEGADGAPLCFEAEGWKRSVTVGADGRKPFGLVELADNNPWVCADSVGVPDPAGTLALIAFGPLIRAGILAEAPTMLTNAPGTQESVVEALASEHWTLGATVDFADQPPVEGVVAATGLAVVEGASSEQIDELYDEAYGRSLFVRRDEDAPWDVKLAAGSPNALFRLRLTPDEPRSLLTILVMASLEGKCGASQLVHAMNVMCGFEESLGTEVPSSTPSTR